MIKEKDGQREYCDLLRHVISFCIAGLRAPSLEFHFRIGIACFGGLPQVDAALFKIANFIFASPR